MHCEECNQVMDDSDPGFTVCRSCGLIEYGFTHTPDIKNIAVYPITPIFYKRKIYFSMLIMNIQGKNIPPVQIFNEIHRKLFRYTFKSIAYLRRLFKKHKLNKYYKFIYYYYYHRIGKRVIDLNRFQFDKIVDYFLTFERYYDELYPHSRNMLNYNFLLKKFFIRLEIPEYCAFIKSHCNRDRIKKLNEIYDNVISHFFNTLIIY